MCGEVLARKPEILVMTTGGTITNPLDTDGYLSGRKLLEGIPEVSRIADTSATDIESTGSSGITHRTWFDLHAEIEAATGSNDPPDGVVITHGSNTVEETAYFLHLTITTERPVVLTAAQRNHRLIGNDGDRNLVDAVKVAGHPDARDRGALVVLNEEIHSARDVTKITRSRPDGWDSSNLGVVGMVDKRGDMGFLRTTEQRHAPHTEFDLSGVYAGDFPAVEIVYCAVDMDGRMVETAVEAGADGIVLAGLPTGSPVKTGQAAAAVDAHADGTPVVNSHCGSVGWSSPDKDYIWANTLSPQKARILLSLALLETSDYDEIERMFAEY